MEIDFTSIILCRGTVSIDAGAVRRQFEEIVPGARLEVALAGSSSGTEGAPKGVVVSFGGLTAAILATDAPLPIESLIYGPSPTLFWPSAEQDLAEHSAHVRVMLVDDEASGQSPVDRATALARLTAAVCKTQAAVGVLWCAADHLLSAARFVQIATTPEDRGGMLSPIWIRLLVAETDRGLVVATHGLAALTGSREIEFAPTRNLDLATLATRAIQLSHYLLQGPQALKEGDVVGPERFTVMTRESGSFEESAVFQLVLPTEP